jgi:hypothetical protein
MNGEPSYRELAGAFARILRETPRLEDAIRVFDAQRVRLLALRDLALDDVVREVAAVFGTTPTVLLSAHLGRQVADARAVFAHILAIRGWSVEQLTGILGEDPGTVRAMTDAVTRHPSLMTLMRLALESASPSSDGFPEHSSTVGSAPNPIPSPISESGNAIRPCRDG